MFLVFLYFIICRFYKLTLSDPTQVTVKLRVSLADLVRIFLAGLPLLVGGGRKPVLGGPVWTYTECPLQRVPERGSFIA
jgi:hypothetical protein